MIFCKFLSVFKTAKMISTYSARIETLGKDTFDTWKLQYEALAIKSNSWGYVGVAINPDRS